MERITRWLSFSIILGSFLVTLSHAGTWGCGGGTATGGGGEQTITIDDFTFSPTELQATPGEMIHVKNSDSVTHTVTSESAENAFDDTSDTADGFDTGSISPGGTADFTVPAGGSPGDVLFFYCEIHKGDMMTPNGKITVIAP